MHSSLVPATREQRERARAFLGSVDARGGTELAAGVEKAARALGRAGGDILILTDGQVFGTEEILRRARAAGTRLFTLGIGSASHDRFLALLARETGGISRFVTPRERVDLTAIDLFASMGQAVASGLKAIGVQPEPPQAVFAGMPVLLFGELDPNLDARVEVTWESGRFELDIPPGDGETGCAVRLLRGSRLITDLESRYPAEEATAPLEKRQQNRIAGRLTELSKTYELASREMSLVAVVKRKGDRAGELPETLVVPVGMPQDTDFSEYFGLSASMAGMMPSVQLDTAEISGTVHFAKQFVKESRSGRRSHRGISAMQSLIRRSLTPDAPANLIDLAAMLEPDGGMPGSNPSVRLARTIAAVFAFVTEGHTSTTGAFRSHVTRLVKFLESVSTASDSEKHAIQRAIDAASKGTSPGGHWLALAREPDTGWERIAEALRI
jgi:hypothetical protein